ncbi:MAG: methyltransferase domain-containing protein [Thermoplasmata archaeon]
MASEFSRTTSLSLATPRGPVPLGFVREGERIYLAAQARSASWPLEILRSGVARLCLPEGPTIGRAGLVTDPAEADLALSWFLVKYGPDLFERWYATPARIVRIDLDPNASIEPFGADRYYEWLEAEFDSIAADYDQHILGNRINRLLRDRSLAWLKPRFQSARRLLDLGCGSGMETLPLLREGHEILAVDLSERMLEVVRTKARAEGLQERLTTRRLAARDLGRLVGEWGEGSIHGAYSTYGALNCESDLTPVAAALGQLLPPGASFVAGVYNRWCLFEILGYGLTGRPGRAQARWKNPVLVGSSRFCVDVYAQSVRSFQNAFRPSFDPVRTEGVAVILPPSDLAAYAETFSRHFEHWAEFDRWVGRRWPWNGLGDHFLLTLERRAAA